MSHRSTPSSVILGCKFSLDEILVPEFLEMKYYDVYSFGRMHASCDGHGVYMYHKGANPETPDECLNGDIDNGEMRRVLLVGLLCTEPHVFLRPSMREATRMLLPGAAIDPQPDTGRRRRWIWSRLRLNFSDKMPIATPVYMTIYIYMCAT